jgi:hypothetical protein
LTLIQIQLAKIRRIRIRNPALIKGCGSIKYIQYRYYGHGSVSSIVKVCDPDLAFLKISDLDRGAEEQNIIILSKKAKKCLTFAAFLGYLYVFWL